MGRNDTAHSPNHQRIVWIAIAYAAVIAIALYPALHEELGAKLLLWNCIPPTIGLLVIATAFDKSGPRLVVSITFALLTASVITFFSAAWWFTPLDLDPHSAITKLVFVFAPVFSLGLASIASGIAWFAVRIG
jgi:hypothetical protein